MKDGRLCCHEAPLPGHKVDLNGTEVRDPGVKGSDVTNDTDDHDVSYINHMKEGMQSCNV